MNHTGDTQLLCSEQQATAKFGRLSEAERTLLATIAELGVGGMRARNEESKSVDEEACDSQHIRGTFLSWILTHNGCRDVLKRTGGLRVSNIRVTEILRVEDVSAPFAITFEGCKFEGSIHLERSKFTYLSLANSCCKGVAANGLRIETDVVLSGLRIDGGISGARPNDLNNDSNSFALALDDAKVFGVVDCRSAHFDCPNGYAISFARSEIHGQCDFSGTIAVGRVRLSDCNIGANLDCSSAKFSVGQDTGDGEYAVDLERAKIGGNCLLRGKSRTNFEVSGAIKLQHAKISGELDCSEALFRQFEGGTPLISVLQPDERNSSRNYSLNASYVTVAGSCFFIDGFSANATVSIRGSNVGGEVVCSRGDFNATEIAIDAAQARIAGAFDLRDACWNDEITLRLGRCGALAISGNGPNGSLMLQYASCKVLEAPPEAWMLLKEYDLEGFRYDSILTTDVSRGLRVAEWIARSKNR